jgi:transcriptional regulator with XRE-family HTH domain
MTTNNLLENILISISPEESLRIENRMLMAAKIEDAMKAKGWKKKDLMIALGKKNQSEITRWLSGTHNFTQDLLTDIGRVLEVNFLNLDDEKPTTNLYYKIDQPIIVLNPSRQSSYLNYLIDSTTYYKQSSEYLNN